MNGYASELNVTPLIDVLLVLVVMFIITVPIATHAVKLDLPVAGAHAPPRPVVDVEIDFDGRVFWNGNGARNDQELQRWFASVAHDSPQPVIKVWPEKRAPYERVAQVLAAAQRARVTNIALAPTQPPG
jgi:biopolymer transport protein ExbD